MFQMSIILLFFYFYLIFIQNPLHRKKLHLALHCERGPSSDPLLPAAGQLGTAWVLRWLDDVGLPQHKDSFLTTRIDGRLLHRLTLDDLAALHVTSALHVASIRTGIQVRLYCLYLSCGFYFFM